MNVTSVRSLTISIAYEQRPGLHTRVTPSSRARVRSWWCSTPRADAVTSVQGVGSSGEPVAARDIRDPPEENHRPIGPRQRHEVARIPFDALHTALAGIPADGGPTVSTVLYPLSSRTLARRVPLPRATTRRDGIRGSGLGQRQWTRSLSGTGRRKPCVSNRTRNQANQQRVRQGNHLEKHEPRHQQETAHKKRRTCMQNIMTVGAFQYIGRDG